MAVYYVYILASRPGGAIYTGVTDDLSLRIWTHRQGRGGLHTKRYGIDKLVYYETHEDVRTAIQRERNVKDLVTTAVGINDAAKNVWKE